MALERETAFQQPLLYAVGAQPNSIVTRTQWRSKTDLAVSNFDFVPDGDQGRFHPSGVGRGAYNAATSLTGFTLIYAP